MGHQAVSRSGRLYHIIWSTVHCLLSGGLSFLAGAGGPAAALFADEISSRRRRWLRRLNRLSHTLSRGIGSWREQRRLLQREEPGVLGSPWSQEKQAKGIGGDGIHLPIYDALCITYFRSS